MEYSLTEKICILNLTNDRIRALKSLQLKELPSNIDPEKSVAPWQEKLIDVDKVVGAYRPISPTSWLDTLDYKYCHKNIDFELFEKYGVKAFEEILLSEPYDGYPEVYEYNGEYYIAGNGLHRLTIAKCIGSMRAVAFVKKIQPINTP